MANFFWTQILYNLYKINNYYCVYRKEISLLIITDNYLSLKHMGNIKILCFLVVTFISCIYIVIIIVLVMYNNYYYYSNNKYYDNHAN